MSKMTKKLCANYTSVDTNVLTNPLLSYKAKGIYSYLISRPDNWEYNMTNVINTSTEGRESVQKGIKELEKVGLLKRIKAQNSEGKFVGWDWEIYDTYVINIADKRENRQSEKPINGKAVHIINNINEKHIFKRKKPMPSKIEEFDDKLVITYPRYLTTVGSAFKFKKQPYKGENPPSLVGKSNNN